MRKIWNTLTLISLLARPAWANEIPCETLEPPLDVSSFGPLRRTFECDIFRREAFSERRLDIHSQQGNLTAFWAQEMVGADLAQDYMERNVSRTQDVPVGIFDGGMAMTGIRRDRMMGAARICRDAVRQCNPDAGTLILEGYTLETMTEHLPQTNRVCPAMNNVCQEGMQEDVQHGTQVGHLLVGTPPVGNSPRAQLAWVRHYRTPVGQNLQVRQNAISQSLKSAHPRPRIINASVSCTYPYEKSCAAFLDDLNVMDRQAIVVKASGNFFPHPSDQSLWPTRRISGISVGSLSPSGLMSDFSSEGSEVAISAPSDNYIRSRHMRNIQLSRMGTTEGPFSGTSGAAPLVSGALSNVMAFLPWANNDDLKEMLRRTAIQTPGFRPNNDRNGAGALNTYALTRIARRIASQGLSEEQARALIYDERTYNFDALVRRLKREAEELMLELPYNRNICNRHKVALRKLRTAFFLDPDNSAIREALADIYRANGYNAQANYIDPDVSARQASEQISSREERVRQLLRSRTFTMDDWPQLRRLLTGLTLADDQKPDLLSKVLGLPQPLANQVFSRLLSTIHRNKAEELIGSIGKFSKAAPEVYAHALTLALRSARMSDSQKGTFLSMAITYLTEEQSVPLFEEALQSSNPNVRKAAIFRTSIALSPTECHRLLNDLIERETDEELLGFAQGEREKCNLN